MYELFRIAANDFVSSFSLSPPHRQIEKPKSTNSMIIPIRFIIIIFMEII